MVSTRVRIWTTATSFWSWRISHDCSVLFFFGKKKRTKRKNFPKKLRFFPLELGHNVVLLLVGVGEPGFLLASDLEQGGLGDMGDDLTGRKTHIADHGHEFLELADIS